MEQRNGKRDNTTDGMKPKKREIRSFPFFPFHYVCSVIYYYFPGVLVIVAYALFHVSGGMR